MLILRSVLKIKTLITIFVMLLMSCNGIDYKYHVIGKVITKEGERNAEWYTDTISFNADTAYYFNTDSSIVKIYPPFKIYELNN